MRSCKRRIIGAEASGDTETATAYKARLNALSKEYKQFSKAADLRTQPERANVANYGTFSGGNVANTAQSSIIKSGAISGALDPDSDEAVQHADRYYAAVRKMTTDVENISKNTGFSLDDIKGIKRYVFEEVHDLGENGIRRFYSNYDMAESWQRLIDGKNIEPHDITLLNHERLERSLVISGYSQDDAHTIATMEYNYAKEVSEYNDKVKKHHKK